MVRLGLLGKNIQHSKSKSVYERLLGCNVYYKLFDFDKKDNIPDLDDFFKQVDGLSITAPYKEYFLDDVILDECAQSVKSINCIKLNSEMNCYYGYNTDYLACSQILNGMNLNALNAVIVVGNGAMTRVILHILRKKNVNLIHVFRKPGFDINDFSLVHLSDSNNIVINCCSRGVIFNPVGIYNKIHTFWDLNYGQDELFRSLQLNNISYINGFELLELQAKFALKIWGIK